MAFLSFHGIYKSFAHKAGRVEALRDVNLEIGQNEFCSVIGPSGCGKTSLLRLCGDLIRPDRGAIRVGSGPPAAARAARQVGIVFQEANLLPWRTALENVRLPLEIIGRNTEEARKICQNLLELVGLAGFEGSYPDELSGGMQQRVAIARALSFNPSILLMDEPFGALDFITRDRMALELLNIWGRTKKTVLFITHSIPEAVFLSDHVAVMSSRPGTILEVVKIDLPRPRELKDRYKTTFLDYVAHITELVGG